MRTWKITWFDGYMLKSTIVQGYDPIVAVQSASYKFSTHQIISIVLLSEDIP